MSTENGEKTVDETQNGDKPKGQFPNPATQFSSTNQPEGRGRPKGRRSLSTIIREIGEGEQAIDWAKLSPTAAAVAKQYGTSVPFEVMVIKAYEQAADGDNQAREWLRKAGYGDKLDITPVVPEGTVSIINAKRISITIQEPGTAGDSGTDAQ